MVSVSKPSSVRMLSVCSPTEIARVRKSLQALRGRLIENGY